MAQPAQSDRREPKRFGTQIPPLTKTIKDILERYPDGGQILKELIQNADDAGASCVKFLVDPRKHPTDHLWKPSLQPMQEPALIAYNDALFTADDWESIGDLSQSRKAEDILKVGRFGIGFQSVHHITDLPVIVSGKYVGILDPHRHHIYEIKQGGEVEGGKLFKISEFCKYIDQAGLFNNLFGFDNTAEEFKGTLFRFPFRTHSTSLKSELSKTIYTETDVTSKLYDSFKFEAERMLLFLKHLTSIELYVWEDSRPKCIFSVSIAENSIENVKNMQQWAKSLLDKRQQSETRLFTCNIVHSEFGPTDPQTCTWLICNTIGFSVSHLKKVSQELKVAPWIGLATKVPVKLSIPPCVVPFSKPTEMYQYFVQLKDKHHFNVIDGADFEESMQKGYIFCFLPLPNDIDGLPVNIHGYFSVDSNRRGIKWPGRDVKGNDAKWNEQLVKGLLIPTYAFFIATKSILFSYSGADVHAPYRWWPVVEKIKCNPTWSALYPNLPESLIQLPVFWTSSEGGKWVRASEAVFLPSDIPDIIVAMLIQLKLPVVSLPSHIESSFDEDKALRIANSKDVCTLLKSRCNAHAVQRCLSNLQLLQEFLIYACEDKGIDHFDNLFGLPVIPTLGRAEPHFLMHKHADEMQLYIMHKSLDDSAGHILFGLEERIVSSELSSDVLDMLVAIANTGTFNISMIDRDVMFPDILKESMLTWCAAAGKVTWNVGKDGHPPKDWLLKVWIWIAKQEMDNAQPNQMVVIQNANGLPLIPVHSLDADSVENVLLPLSAGDNQNVFYCDKDSSSSTTIPSIVDKLGFCIVEHSKCISDLMAVQPLLSGILPSLTPQTLLQTLNCEAFQIDSINIQLDNTERSTLREFLFQCIKTASEDDLKFLRSLPIHSSQTYPIAPVENAKQTPISCPNSVIFLSPDVVLPPNVQLPLPVLITKDEESDSYAALLGRKPLREKQLITDYILSHLPVNTTQNRYIEKDIALWILQHTMEDDEDLISSLSNTQLVTSMVGGHYFPRELMDTSDQRLSSFFVESERTMFPHPDYNLFLKKLKWLGLQTWESISSDPQIFTDFMKERALLIAKQNGSCYVRKISENIVVAVAKSQDKLKSGIWGTLQDICFIYCQTKPPKQYIGNWKGSECKNQPLCLSQVCVPLQQSVVLPSDLPYLVGSVHPLPSSSYQGLLDGVSVCQQVTSADVHQHLQHVATIVSESSGIRVTDVSHTIPKIYNCIQSFLQTTSIRSNVTQVWNEDEGRFIDIQKIALKAPISLIPYRYCISDFKGMDKFRILWEASEIKETFLPADYVTVLDEMQTKGALKSTSLDTCLKILTHLSSTPEDLPLGTILLPNAQQKLEYAKECFYDNREWVTRHPNIVNSFSVVHSRVPNNQALHFGARSLSEVLGNPQKIQFCCSDLATSPLQAIREHMSKYTSTLDVLKELIQNADDAGATEVKFLIDWRQHPTDTLFTSEMRHWQGPALYAYNNSVFSDEDVRNICRLGYASAKQVNVHGHPCNTSGFSSVYKFTDVPMLISGKTFLVLDPHGQNLTQLKPNDADLSGVMFDLERNGHDLEMYYSDQLKPFDGVFDVQLEHFACGMRLNSTIFRLPLRTRSAQSHLSNWVLEVHEKNLIEDMVKEISQLADRMLLFTRKVKKVDVYEQPKVETHQATNPKCILTIERHVSTSQNFTDSELKSKEVNIEWSEEDAKKTHSCGWILFNQKEDIQSVQQLTIAVPSTAEMYDDQCIWVPRSIGQGSLSSFLPLNIAQPPLFPNAWRFAVNIVNSLGVEHGQRRISAQSKEDILKIEQIENEVMDMLAAILHWFTSHWTTASVTVTEGILKQYYELWIPHDSFFQQAFDSGKKLVFTESKTWMALHCVSVLDESLLHRQVVHLLPRIVKILLASNVTVANLPECISYCNLLTKITFKYFCEEALFRSIRQLRKGDSSIYSDIEPVLKFILLDISSKEPWLKEGLRDLSCIPTLPSGNFRMPCELMDRNDPTLCELYSIEDEVFPTKEYSGEPLVTALHSLGMKRTVHSLEGKDIVNRAQSIVQICDINKAMARSKAILLYLSNYSKPKEIAEILQSVPFLPIKNRPATLTVPWCSREGTFVAPGDLYLPKSSNVKLVFSQYPLLSDDINLFKTGDYLLFKRDIPLEVVLRHLLCLVDWSADQQGEMSNDDFEMINSTVYEIYKFIDDHSQNHGQVIQGMLANHPIVWVRKICKFIHLNRVSRRLPEQFSMISLSPYWRTANDLDCLHSYHSMWECLKVKSMIDVDDATSILKEIHSQMKKSGRSISNTEIEIVIKILEFFKAKDEKKVVLPTESGKLLTPQECVFDDRDWGSKKEKLKDRFEFVHSKVTGELARYFGVAPVTTRLLAPKKIMFKRSGQSEPLTRRLKGIIDDYKDNIDVFKELIQNADDAGATEVKFLIDWRQHPTDTLFAPEMRHWQGPALYAYNNSVFSDNDFKNICELGGATKKGDATKIGRFGLGFCATYHLTDLPSFVSRGQLTIFDPHKKYIKDVMDGDSPGLFVDFIAESSDLNNLFHDQMEAYEGVFGCSCLNGEEFHGTLFRFPFRNENTAQTSEISKETFTQESSNELTQVLFKEAEKLLVFLTNVNTVELYEVLPLSDLSTLKPRMTVTKHAVDRRGKELRQLYAKHSGQPDLLSTQCTTSFEINVTRENEGTSSCTWLTSSALGVGDCLKLSKSEEVMKKGLVPFAEIAVPVKRHGSGFIPQPVLGQLFCFLPLPITTNVKFLVNGTFDISKDRRHLADVSDKSIENSWNKLLIKDVVVKAFMNLLEQLAQHSTCTQDFMQGYYSLWPQRVSGDDLHDILNVEFTNQLFEGKCKLILTESQQWEMACSACTLEKESFRCFEHPVKAVMIEHLVKCGCRVACIPDDILVGIASLGRKITELTFQTFCEDYFVGRIEDLSDSSRDCLLISILKHSRGYTWLKELLGHVECIPTRPAGTLLAPSRLINPDMKMLTNLYEDSDQRFPTDQYHKVPKVMDALKSFGMISDILPEDDVFERAHSIESLQKANIHMASVRSRHLVTYLLSEYKRDYSRSGYMHSKTFLDRLSEVPFLPQKSAPAEWSKCWYKCNQEFIAPSKLYKLECESLVFTQHPVVGYAEANELRLRYLSTPSAEIILDHLCSIVHFIEYLPVDDSVLADPFLESSIEEVYSTLNADCNLEAAVGSHPLHEPLVWNRDRRCFLSVSQVALRLPRDLTCKSLHPYRWTSNDVWSLKHFSKLWRALDVKEEFSASDCQSVLEEMASKEALSKEDISIAIGILEFLQSQQVQAFFVPTSANKMCEPTRTVFDDRKWSEKEGLKERFVFVHEKVTSSLARFFGVSPISSKLLAPKKVTIFKKSGQNESLTRRLKGIIDDYKDTIDVFKELIQNADDAGATEMKFLIDWRQHPTDTLFTPEMRHWQGPALYAYNNSEFSDKDFKNICELGGATKKGDVTKIGQFGLGFCATYQLTDLPSFVSRGQLTIFDPHKKYIKDVMEVDSPGLFIDFTAETGSFDLNNLFRDQMEPYEGVFGCSCLKGVEFSGTLFRFPFRNKDTAKSSEISSTVIDESHVAHLLQSLHEAADTILVFLKHVQQVELYTLDRSQNQPTLLGCVVKEQQTSSRNLMKEFISTSESKATQCSSQFTIKSTFKGGTPHREWLISSAVGFQVSETQRQFMDKVNEGCVPFAEVAVPVMKQNLALIPQPVEGQLFCFLPLPRHNVNTKLKCLVNGTFELSKERRYLKNLQASEGSWNKMLIKDVLIQAFIQLLSYLCQGYSNLAEDRHHILQNYYSIWPLVEEEGSDLDSLVEKAFIDYIPHTTERLVVTDNGDLKCVTDIFVQDLQQGYQPGIFDSKMISLCQDIMANQGVPLATLPSNLVSKHFIQPTQRISFKSYCDQHFFNHLSEFDAETISHHLLFMLSRYFQLEDTSTGWLKDSFCSCRCIRTQPYGTLVTPSKLILPGSPVAPMYSIDDERFPGEEYLESETIKKVLCEFGMSKDRLGGEDIVERAQSVLTLPLDQAKQRSLEIVKYLSLHAQGDSAVEDACCQLIHVRFLYTHTTEFSATNIPPLAAPSETYLPKQKDLIFTHSPVLHFDLAQYCSSGLFRFKGRPSHRDVVEHFKNLIEYVNGGGQGITNLNEIVMTIYEFLDDEDVERELFHSIYDQPFVWDDVALKFIDSREVAIDAPATLQSLMPYRKTGKEIPCLAKFRGMWKKLGIKQSHDVSDSVAVLKEMSSISPIDEHDVDLAVRILEYLRKGKCTPEFEGVLIPTATCILVPPHECVFDDRHWSAKRRDLMGRFQFTHQKIYSELAKYFKISPISRKIASPTQLKITTEGAGQKETLTTRLRGIIEDYKDNIDVFKELIQNADDAGATEVKFLIDWRQHPTENLFTPEMRHWQGPALYAYNNSVFNDKDFKNICELGGATKREDPTKIGRFGLGFCAVYNITDVPSFMSRSTLVLFDPHTKYLGDLVAANEPGLKFDFVEQSGDLNNYYSDQVSVYQNVFGCSLENKLDGTLFRLPFRSEEAAARSKIWKDTFSTEQAISDLVKSLTQNANHILLFLNNVKMIELHVNTSRTDLLDSQLVLKVTRDDFNDIPASTYTQAEKKFSISTKQLCIEVITSDSESDTEMNTSSTWLVSSAQAQQGCKLCNFKLSTDKSLSPKFEVAAKIERSHSNTWIPKPLDQGRVFCYLPLPITIEHKFLVNGQFLVSKDRRDLVDLQDSSTGSWNQLLIHEVGPPAILKLLQQMVTLMSPIPSDSVDAVLTDYYSMWPLSEPAHPLSKELKDAFPRAAFECSYPIVWSLYQGGKWLPLNDVKFMEDVFYFHNVFDTARTDILHVLVQFDYKIVNISDLTRRAIEAAEVETYAQSTVTIEEYVTKVFLPNLENIEEVRCLRQLFFLLEHYKTLNDIESTTSDWLKEALIQTKCIPCEPDGILSAPQDLICPTETFSCLFAVEEGRFPLPSFLSHEAVKFTLSNKLGMCEHVLRDVDVIDRAKRARTLPSDEVQKYCAVFCRYLESKYSSQDTTEQETILLEKLTEIEFFPLLTRPHDLSLPWHSGKLLAAPAEVYPPRHLSTVFTFGMIPDRKVIDQNCLSMFGPYMKSPPPMALVLENLLTLVHWGVAFQDSEPYSSSDAEFLEKHTKKTYVHIERFLNISVADVAAPVIDILKKECFLWVDRKFQRPSQCVQSCRFACYPYLTVVKLDCPRLLSMTGVDHVLNKAYAESVLTRIATIDYISTPVSEDLLRFIRELVDFIAGYLKSSPQSAPTIYYLPDRHCVMHEAEMLVCSEWDDDDETPAQKKLAAICPPDTHYLHVSIPKIPAIRLGVKDILTCALEQLSEGDFDDDDSDSEEFEQQEPLTTRLNNLLKQYKGDGTIFKEFIQNADDAEATEIAFVIDERSFGTESLISHSPVSRFRIDQGVDNWRKLQTIPSLLVYNNHKFTDEDIKGITQLGKGGKDGQTNKIGRFGVGFNVAYHVTDCPMFLSFDSDSQAENFCVFDPNKAFLPKYKGKRKGGKRMNLKKNPNAYEAFSDQFEPFLQTDMSILKNTCPGSFNDHSNGHVVFRLPLTRCEKMIYDTSLNHGRKMTVEILHDLSNTFREQASSMLLFLSHLKRISFCTIAVNGGIEKAWTVSASNTTENVKQTEFLRKCNEALGEIKMRNGYSTKVVEEVFDITTEEYDLAGEHRQPFKVVQWLVSKRFGGGDIDELVLKDSYNNFRLLPIVGVATPIGKHSHRGKLFSSLPLPAGTNSCFHIHGHFSIDPSRTYLDDSEWNQTLITGIVSKACVSLLCRAKYKVEEWKASRDIVKWFYNLFLRSDYDPSMECLKDLPKSVYQLLVSSKAEVLLSYNNTICWYALTENDQCENKGWFHYDHNSHLCDVFFAIRIKLTKAPNYLKHTTESLVPSYHGSVTAALVRKALRSIVSHYNDYWEDIVPNISDLMIFVLRDLTKHNVHKLDGLPLLLTKSGTFRCIDLDKPLFNLQYVGLVDPSDQAVGGRFVHPDLTMRIIKDMEELGLIVNVTPEYIAENVKSCIARGREVDFSSKTRRTLSLLWEYIRQHCKVKEAKDVFGQLAILPTSRRTLVPLLEACNVLNDYGQNDAFLHSFKVPIVDFTLVFPHSSGQDSETRTSTVMSHYVEEILANSKDSDGVLSALVVAVRNYYQHQTFPQLAKTDVLQFILFVQEAKDVGLYRKELRSLPIFQSTAQEWVQAPPQEKVYAVQNVQHILCGMKTLHDKVTIVLLYEGCEKFFESIGICVMDTTKAYKHIIIPHFEHLHTSDRIHHLKNIAAVDSMDSNNFNLLRSKAFIESPGTPSQLVSPSELFDPVVELFKCFLKPENFPPHPWNDEAILVILRKLDLVVKVDVKKIVKFAHVAAGLPSTNDTAIKTLLSEIKERITEGMSRSDLRGMQNLLEGIQSICFVPPLFPEDLRKALLSTNAQFTPQVTSKRICFRNSVLCSKKDSQLVCLCRPVVKESLVISHRLSTNDFNRLSVLRMLSATCITPQLVAGNLLELARIVGTCTLTSDESCRNAIPTFQTVFKAHYEYLSMNTLVSGSDDDIIIKLKEASCVFVPSQDSYQLVKGCKLVERVTHENRAYSQYIHTVPDYLNDSSLKQFRETVGVERTLTASHFVSLFQQLRQELIGQMNQLFTEDPNLDNVVYHGYHDFLTLLQSSPGDNINYVERTLRNGGIIYLPSESGELVPTTDLVLCDDKWFRDNIPEEKRPKFILHPPSDSLPPCLKVQKLTELVTENLDTNLLNDRYNLCDMELYAEQNNLGYHCEDVVALNKLLISEEFGTGLLRIMNHKSKVTDDHRKLTKRIQDLRIICVRKIETKFSYKGQSFQGTSEVALMDSSSDLLKLYVCFHDDDTSGSSDPRVLDGIALQLHKCVGPYIPDSHHLQTIMRQISDPSKIESALDHEHISRYRPEPTQDTGVIGDRNAVIKEDFELLILCNFRKDEYVKYCDKDGVIKATMITGIGKDISASNPVAQAMPPVLDLITKDDIKLPNVSCLLVCKYILAGQRSAIQSQLSTASSSQPTATTDTSEKVVLLKLPLDNQEKFTRYVRGVLRLFSVDVQKYFAIERLLFQIHYWCVIEHKSAQKMTALMDGFLQCIRSELDQSKEENKEFFRKQVIKVDAMLGRNQPSVLPVVAAGSSQGFSYSAHSSWTARPSQGIHGLPCSSYWSPAPQPASTSATAPSSQVPSYSRPPGTGPGRSMPRYALVEGEQGGMDLEPEPTTSISDAVMWLQQAWRDLNLAQHLLPSTAVPRQRQDHGYPEAVCFYSHEVVEKTLKAVFLAYCGLRHSLASYHHIVDLCEILSKHPNCPESIKEASLRSHVLFVSRHGDCCRFPDSNLPPAPPMHTHSISTATEVLSSASTFLRKVAELEKFKEVFPTGDLDNIELPDVVADYPTNWVPMPENKAYNLYIVKPKSPEYKHIADLFKKTLPNVKIHCIERIQNRELWTKYKDRRREIERDADLRIVDEIMLFHGTRGTPPEMIYGSETGFDLRFSQDGLWGYGNYFAVNAKYSLNFAYNKGNNQNQMFVARVSPGASKNHGHNQVRCKVPPERETTGSHQSGQIKRRYNSVKAITGGSEIYITYENYLAYPQYLITFIK